MNLRLLVLAALARRPSHGGRRPLVALVLLVAGLVALWPAPQELTLWSRRASTVITAPARSTATGRRRLHRRRQEHRGLAEIDWSRRTREGFLPSRGPVPVQANEPVGDHDHVGEGVASFCGRFMGSTSRIRARAYSTAITVSRADRAD